MLPSFFFDSAICSFVIKQTADFHSHLTGACFPSGWGPRPDLLWTGKQRPGSLAHPALWWAWFCNVCVPSPNGFMLCWKSWAEFWVPLWFSTCLEPELCSWWMLSLGGETHPVKTWADSPMAEWNRIFMARHHPGACLSSVSDRWFCHAGNRAHACQRTVHIRGGSSRISTATPGTIAQEPRWNYNAN